jgi:hypothetical protein
MSDMTAGAGEAYAACKTLFEDLNHLADDYRQAIRDTGVNLPKKEEYSYSPNELVMKRDHVWMSYRFDDNVLTFAAAYVIFEPATNHVKLGPAGRPEIWFLLGRAIRPRNNPAVAVRDMFMTAELPHFRPKLRMGGDIAYYDYDVPGERWSVVLLGLEIGDIDSSGTLHQRVIAPLRAAASERAIQL